MSEPVYTTTFRLPQQDAPQLTVRAGDAEEFEAALAEVPRLASLIQEASEGFRAVVTVGEVLGGRVESVQKMDPTSTSTGGQTAQSSGALPGKDAASDLLLGGEHRVAVDDKFGRKIAEYNRPDAPSTVRGPKVLITQKTKAGDKWYTMWYDPSDSPAWYPRPKTSIEERKNARDFPDNETVFDHDQYKN